MKFFKNLVLSVIAFLLALQQPIDALTYRYSTSQIPDSLIYRSSDHDYPYNPFVPLPIWDIVQPYFLPENHPLKKKLDAIFKASRVTLNVETFKTAGFLHVKERKIDNIFACKHPDLKGILVKTYLDTQPITDDWNRWLGRIMGSDIVRDCIKRHGYEDLFDVPFKWVYPMPMKPLSIDNPAYVRKNFVLIVEDMRLLSYDENVWAYKAKITRDHLDALYTLLTECGLLDSIYISNIPFNKDGKMVVIDTEHYHRWPIPYDKLTFRFSVPMQAYWQELIRNSGPTRANQDQD